MTLAWVLAHQGGWDELLLVAAPVVLFGLLLHSANKRAAATAEAKDPVEGTGYASDRGSSHDDSTEHSPPRSPPTETA